MDELLKANPSTLIFAALFLVLAAGRIFVKREELALIQETADVERERSYYRLSDYNADRLVRIERMYDVLSKRFDTTKSELLAMTEELEISEAQRRALAERVKVLEDEVRTLKSENEALRREKEEGRRG